MNPRLATTVALVASLLSSARAEEPVSFNRDVRPILAANCFACHGPDEHGRQADLRLDLAAEEIALRDGRRAIQPGNPAASEVVRRITSRDPDEVMPPPSSNKSLKPAQVDTLRRWIAGGAKYEQHWAFVAPRPVTPPAVPDAWKHWPRGPIDQFIVSRVLRENLKPSPEADRFTLVRRVYLDLIGLPPTPEEADEFARDPDPRAYERLVDRLLESRHYGERWAARWLDLARYADTNGYEKDRPRNIWPFRDWVIRAINADLPFDQFTIEQLAGDLLPHATPEQLVATGLHRNTMLNEEGGIDPLEFRFYAVNDRVATTATTWLGLTMGCVQCHTHKYDPIAHTEYYRFFALLNNADELDLDLPPPDATAAQRQRDEQAARLRTTLADRWPLPAGTAAEQRPALVDAAFAEWLARERKRSVVWTPLRPSTATSNLPLLTVQPDDSVFASGDCSKDDTYVLTFDAPPAGITGLRLEALPDDRLPAHGPGMTYYEGPKGDFFLGEFQVAADGRPGQRVPVPIARASESYAKNHFGSNPVSAKLATDGDPQTGWTCAGRFGEPHQAVFVFAEPLGRVESLRVSLRFGRHYACPLGRFRLSATTDPHGGEARDLPPEIESLLTRPDEQLTAEQRSKLRDHFLLTAPPLAAESQKIRDLERRPAAPTTLVFRERPADHPRPTFRHHRGEFLQPRERVEPGVPAFLATRPVNDRLALARWLVSPENPLTARVAVNREWAAFFGHGLVRTLGDFGVQGDTPSHPELLDFLATEFVRDGWSRKRLHRRIVTSAAYRQSSAASPESLAKDPQNRWLSRMPRVRLDAELVRDAALRASGLLSEKMFGPPVRPPQPVGVTEVAYGAQSWKASSGEDRYRRGLYTFRKRTAPYAMFATFDAPSFESCVAQREVSNTPLQALTLLNDEVFWEAAQALGRLAAMSPDQSDAARATLLFRRCLTRAPTDAERERLVGFVQQQRTRLERGELTAASLAPGVSDPATAREAACWTTLARALLNVDEMVARN